MVESGFEVPTAGTGASVNPQFYLADTFFYTAGADGVLGTGHDGRGANNAVIHGTGTATQAKDDEVNIDKDAFARLVAIKMMEPTLLESPIVTRYLGTGSSVSSISGI